MAGKRRYQSVRAALSTRFCNGVAAEPLWDFIRVPQAMKSVSAFGTLFGMLILNGLPKPSHPLDKYPPFRRVTDDKFFISIEASDPRFDIDSAQSFLSKQGGLNVTVVEE